MDDRLYTMHEITHNIRSLLISKTVRLLSSLVFDVATEKSCFMRAITKQYTLLKVYLFTYQGDQFDHTRYGCLRRKLETHGLREHLRWRKHHRSFTDIIFRYDLQSTDAIFRHVATKLVHQICF